MHNRLYLCSAIVDDWSGRLRWSRIDGHFLKPTSFVQGYRKIDISTKLTIYFCRITRLSLYRMCWNLNDLNSSLWIYVDCVKLPFKISGLLLFLLLLLLIIIIISWANEKFSSFDCGLWNVRKTLFWIKMYSSKTKNRQLKNNIYGRYQNGVLWIRNQTLSYPGNSHINFKIIPNCSWGFY